MKNCLLIALTCCVLNIYAQDKSGGITLKKFYVGIGAGPNFMVNPSDIKTGLNVNAINSGYLFTKHFGLSLMISEAMHHYETSGYHTLNPDDGIIISSGTTKLRLVNMMVGPMVAFTLGRISSLDVRARVGGYYTKASTDNAKQSDFNPGYSFGLGYRVAFAKHWCGMASSDFVSGKDQHTNISAINVSLGVGVQF